MAFVFHCPQCASTLKTGAPISDGHPIQCPKCHHVFTTADTAVREEAADPFPPAPASAEPPLASPVDEPRDWERTPSRRRDEDDRDSRRRDEPRRRRRYDDDRDYDRDRPRSRRRYDEDDYPPRRRRYEDEYDRPRRRPPASSGGRTVLIVILVAAAALIALVALVWHSMDDDEEVARQPFAPGVDTEMLAMAPADSAVIAGIDVDQLRKHGKFSRTIGQLIFSNIPDRHRVEQQLNDTGLTEHDVSGIMVAASAPGGSGMVIAIRFNKNVDRDRIVKAVHARRRSHEFKSYYTDGPRDSSGFFFAGKRMIVFAQQHSTLTELLHHDHTQIRIGPGLRDLAARAQGVYWGAIRKDGGPAAIKGMGGGFGADELFHGFAEQSEGVLVSFSAQDDQLDCEVGMKVKANKNAQDLAQQLQADVRNRGALNNGGFAADERALEQAVVQTASFRVDGPVAYVKFRVSIDLFARFVQNARGNRIGFGQ